MKEYTLYIVLLASIVSAMVLTSCDGEELTVGQEEQNSVVPADVRPLVQHEVTVGLEGAATRVGYASQDNGLALSWEASEILGVYIQKANNTYIYAGKVSSSGSAGGGERKFTGEISEKTAGEKYVYVHPAPAGETTQGNVATGKINLDSQSGSLGSPAHLKTYIPLIWREGSSQVENHGYAVHLKLTFNENPGTISKVTLRTMPGVGNTDIFPSSFDAATMSANGTMKSQLTFDITSGSATKTDDKWTVDAYLACSHRDVDVFRTKYDVKVESKRNDQNLTFYNEFVSFPGQQDATSITGLPMLANGKCYNLEAKMSKDAATTIINTQYKVNSLLGMWNEFGKTTDPFSLTKTSALPSQLTDNILGTQDKKTAFTDRTLVNKSSQGSPTFTWDMVTKQCEGNYKQANVTYNNINIVTPPTEVFVTFISEYAWSQNLLGYYHYPTGSVPSSSNDVLKTIIFPNVSKGGHVPYNKGGSENIPNVNPNTDQANVGTSEKAPLQEYTTVQLLYNNPDGTYSTQFPAGTTIGFFMMRDPKASSSGSDLDTEHQGQEGSIDHTGYQPRTDNTLLDWNSWRLFTNTAWNSASGNDGWWNMNCQNFFCSADVGNKDSGGAISGLALYGAKDDASHNYNYSFSAMLFMVSTSMPSSMQTQNKAYFNIGPGAQIIEKQ